MARGYHTLLSGFFAFIRQGTVTETAPTDAGDYKASITLGEGQNSATAYVEYTIAPIDISSVAVTNIAAPVATETMATAAVTATEHVILSNSGAITWDPAAPDGQAAYATVYKATVTAAAGFFNGKTSHDTFCTVCPYVPVYASDNCWIYFSHRRGLIRSMTVICTQQK